MRRRIVVGPAVLVALALVLGAPLASRRNDGAVRTGQIGHAPGSLLPDPRTGHIFVCNAADNTVDTIDERTGALVRAAAVGFSPTMTVLDRRTGHVLVLGAAGIGLSILDAASGRLIGAVSLEASPVAIAVSGRLPRTVALRSAPDLVLVNAVTGRIFTVGADGVGILDERHGTLLRTVAENWDYRLRAEIDARSGEVAVVAAPPDGPNNADQMSDIMLFDGRSGNPLRGEIPTGVGPVALSVDERTGRAVVLNQGGVVAADDPWSWIPGGLRHFLPFIPRQGPATRAVPASVTIVDLSR